MTRMTGRRALLEMLRAEGVKYIFGNPGTSEIAILDALEDFPEMQYMLGTQEGVAMGMADGYARATGNPAFVSLHVDTGLANGVSLLTNASAAGVPMVLTSVNKDVRRLAEGRSDLVEMVKQFTKWSAEVTHGEQVPGLMRRAFKEARTPPTGPTYVAFSAGALDDEADMDIVPSARGYFRTAPDRAAIEEASRILADAANPVMLVGDRVAKSGASAEVVRVAELLGVKVYAVQYAEMNFPTDHSQFLGPIRPIPSATRQILDSAGAERRILDSADAVLAVGTSISGRGFAYAPGRYLGENTRLIHIDSAYDEIDKIEPTDVGILADPKVAMADLADALESRMSGSAREGAKGRAVSASEERAAQKAASQKRLKERWDMRPMPAERMMAEIASVLPPDTIIANDAATASSAIFDAMEFNEPGSIIGFSGGALGWGMGGAMGMKLAHPDRPVVAVVGDGGAMMTVQALWTAANANIPVVYVICDNRSYRILKMGMDVYKSRVLKEDGPRSQYIGMDFPIPLNIAGIAEAMGVYGRKIEDPAELAPAMRHALDLGKPAVLDVSIDGSF